MPAYRRRHHAHATAAADQVAQDVALDAVVVGNDERARGVRPRGTVATRERPVRLRPVVRLATGDLLHQVAADQAGGRLGLGDDARGIGVGCGQHRLLRATLANVPHQGAGIDPLDGGDVVGDEVVAQALARAPVARLRPVLLDDEPLQERTPRLDVLRVDADVADLRVGHRHQLTAVRRVGEDLLVSGHRGVEHHLADGFAFGAEGLAFEDGAVGQCQ
jgi:hypothetical protein